MSNNHADPEIWTSPMGQPAELHFKGLATCDCDEGCEAWYADFPGQTHPRTWELTVVGQPFDVVASVTLSPYSAYYPYEALADHLIRCDWTPPEPTAEELATCEHGLSLQLCAGPGHYPLDDRQDWV